jgi:hypothetical protein
MHKSMCTTSTLFSRTDQHNKEGTLCSATPIHLPILVLSLSLSLSLAPQPRLCSATPIHLPILALSLSLSLWLHNPDYVVLRLFAYLF